MFQQNTAQKLYHFLNSFHSKSKQLEKSIGLTPERLDILHLLVSEGPKTINQLADCESVSAPAITRTIKALEKHGYVIKSRSKTDQRVVFVAPTRKSQHIIESLRIQQHKWINEALSGISDKELEVIKQGLDLIGRTKEAGD